MLLPSFHFGVTVTVTGLSFVSAVLKAAWRWDVVRVQFVSFVRGVGGPTLSTRCPKFDMVGRVTGYVGW
jgi:hypothetical protein